MILVDVLWLCLTFFFSARPAMHCICWPILGVLLDLDAVALGNMFYNVHASPSGTLTPFVVLASHRIAYMVPELGND